MNRLEIFCMVGLLAVGVAMTERVYTTKGENWGTHNEEDLDLVIELSIAKDIPALSSLVDEGKAFKLKEGLQCYLIDSTSTGKVKCRLRGTDVFFWTAIIELE